jgi:hypothetical protein
LGKVEENKMRPQIKRETTRKVEGEGKRGGMGDKRVMGQI